MAESPTMTLSVGGKTETIRFDQLNAIDARDFRRELGMSLTQAFASTPDLDTLVGLLWLARRRRQPGLTFEQVAAKVGYADLEIAKDDEDDDAEGSDPETSGGHS